MELQIGNKLRNLRRERNLTQEEVANHLGISFQAISKWERCEGLPDITILPALARYFGISLDDLFDMKGAAAAEAFEEINRQWEENARAGLHRENVALMQAALKDYPNNALLLVQLSASLDRLDGTEQEKREYLRRSIAIQEQILLYGEDPEVVNATRYNICFAYWKNGQREKAVTQAEKLPNLYKARENALIYFLEGEAKRSLARQALEPLTWALSTHLTALGETEKRDQILDILKR